MAKNQEVKAYLKLSDEALESAQLLYDNQKFRDCVSRAYYSMFYMAKALLCNTERPAHKHRGDNRSVQPLLCEAQED